MKVLNDRYDYGLDLFLLSIDEGITGYRDDSLEVRALTRLGACRPHAGLQQRGGSCPLLSRYMPVRLTTWPAGSLPPQTVKRNQQQYDLPLKILSYDDLYGWTMDRIVSAIGKKNNCASPVAQALARA